MQIVGRRYDTGQPVRITAAGGKIDRLEPMAATEAAHHHLPWLAPGFIDVQVNGYGGQAFNDARLTPEMVFQVSCAMDGGGVTTYLPTAVILDHFKRTVMGELEMLVVDVSRSRGAMSCGSGRRETIDVTAEARTAYGTTRKGVLLRPRPQSGKIDCDTPPHLRLRVAHGMA